MTFFWAAMRWFIGKYWPYLLVAAAIVGLGVKIWIWRGEYEDAKAAKEAAEKQHILGIIRNRPSDPDTVVKRLRSGTF